MIPCRNGKGVVENGLGPGQGLAEMTGFTIGVKSCFYMIGVPGIVIVIQVTVYTIAWNVITLPVTTVAIQPPVGPS